MSDTSMPTSPLPLTTGNAVVGAGLTVAIFIALMACVGGVIGGIFGFVIALIVASVASIIAAPLVGVPLSLLAARLLKASPVVWQHLVAQFAAGAVAGAVVVGMYALLTVATGITGSLDDSFRLASIGLVICTGLSAAGGWCLAYLSHKRRSPGEIAILAKVRA